MNILGTVTLVYRGCWLVQIHLTICFGNIYIDILMKVLQIQGYQLRYEPMGERSMETSSKMRKFAIKKIKVGVVNNPQFRHKI